MKICLSTFYKIAEEPFEYYIHWCAESFFLIFFNTSCSDWPSHYLGKHYYFLKLYAASFDTA